MRALLLCKILNLCLWKNLLRRLRVVNAQVEVGHGYRLNQARFL